MRKKYIRPETNQFVLAVHHALLTSSTFTVNVHEENYDEDDMTSLSRRTYDAWSEEDDEEDMCQ